MKISNQTLIDFRSVGGLLNLTCLEQDDNKTVDSANVIMQLDYILKEIKLYVTREYKSINIEWILDKTRFHYYALSLERLCNIVILDKKILLSKNLNSLFWWCYFWYKLRIPNHLCLVLGVLLLLFKFIGMQNNIY